MAIANWNVLFGRHGFHEIQVLIQDDKTKEVSETIEKIAQKYPIFLAGIKRVSHQGLGLLSFTRPGWSIAINIPGKYITRNEVQKILSDLAQEFGSPQYLAKDSALNNSIFDLMYPQAESFREYRRTSGTGLFFESEMSKRLLL